MSDAFSRKDFSRLPETTGLFCLFDAQNKALFAGAAKNIKEEIKRILDGRENFFNQFSELAGSIEIWRTSENLPRELARLVRQKQPRFNFPINDKTIYPHLKITREKFPRLLVTRRILSEQDEYFGAFLPITGVRIWLYVLSRLFRLRSCELDIRGGDLPAPCPMFAEKRCLAPCVENLCEPEEYAEAVDLLRLFLMKNKSDLEKILRRKIENLAENLEFEKAVRLRDLTKAIQDIFANPRLNLWLDDAVDTYYLEKDSEKTLVHLITTRGRRTLGFHTFDFPNDEKISDSQILSRVLWQFYQFHAPREIRLTKDFENRKFFAESLSRQAKRRIKVSLVSEEEHKTAFLSLKRSKLSLELKRLSNIETTDEIRINLQEIFSLPEKPKRIEAFDVAHISNQDFVAACAVWENENLKFEDFRFWQMDSVNEPQALAEAVKLRLNENKERADLILLDGGRNQLKAVKKILENENLKIVGAVKPSGRHNEISHFLTDNGKKIDFQFNSTFEILRRLRDEAHALANSVHRQTREINLLAGKNREAPILVPIRFDEPGGAAENFRPISNFKLKI
ncbi:MAG TPA: excinuclease ABC subunit UvrC [Pyrinomonadaceae bacterium]|jgi:excinuclease ABC subunit C